MGVVVPMGNYLTDEGNFPIGVIRGRNSPKVYDKCMIERSYNTCMRKDFINVHIFTIYNDIGRPGVATESTVKQLHVSISGDADDVTA